MTAVRVSVILPVRNGEPYLRDQLAALAGQTASFPWELIVVDNASTDSSAATARSFADDIACLTVLTEERRGKSYALNSGIAAARGAHLVFLDADDVCAPDYLERMAEGLERYEMVCARADLALLNPDWAQGGGWRTDGLTSFLDWMVFVPGGLLGIRAEARRTVGDFSCDFRCGEDVDFTWRAQLLGVTTGFVPEAVVHVRRPLTTWETFRKGRGYGRAHVHLYSKFRELGQPRRHPRAVARHVRGVIAPLVRRQDHGSWWTALEGGVLLGRAEECLRRHVLYP